MPAHLDSIDKIVSSYFSLITLVPYTYKGRVTTPRALQASPLLFRNLVCPAHCGACCPRFSLDYLPNETRPEFLTPRLIAFDDREIVVMSDRQLDRAGEYFCRHLIRETARCAIHDHNPFSCDFEIIRALTFDDASHPHRLSTQAFGRAWNMKRIDEQRGAMCGIEEGFERARGEVVRKLSRLADWADHFGIRHRARDVVAWAQSLDAPPAAAKLFE